MPPRESKEPSRAALSSGLTYVAKTPSFLANFGKAAGSGSGSDAGETRRGRDGRELPSRPSEGEWARGSDDESGGEEDEWDKMYGGGEEGPQVVVLKEGRHLSADEVARERRRARGEVTPPRTEKEGEGEVKDEGGAGAGAAKETKERTKPGAKRKLVGDAVARQEDAPKEKKKKKGKAVKTLLSFDEAEGEE